MHILRCASSRTSFKGGDVMVSIHEPHNTIIYLILDSLYFDVFFANPSLIVRSSYIVPILNLKGKCKKKIFLSWLFKKKWLSLPQNLLLFLQCSKLQLDCDEILFTILFSVIIYWLSAFSRATASRGACGY